MEKITLPTGREVTLNLNSSTLRRAFQNPYLPVVQKMYEAYLEVKDLKEDDLPKNVNPALNVLGNIMEHLEAIDRVISIVCSDPKFWLPDDGPMPEGYESTDNLEDKDRLAIYQMAMGYLGEFGGMFPFRGES